MNRKQSKMLKHMGATRRQKREWRTWSADKKGAVRAAYYTSGKLAWMPFPGD
jgi:hypothetical protein